MATLKELKELMAKSNLTDQQIAELISTLTSMQKANEGNSQAVSLPLTRPPVSSKCATAKSLIWSRIASIVPESFSAH